MSAFLNWLKQLFSKPVPVIPNHSEIPNGSPVPKHETPPAPGKEYRNKAGLLIINQQGFEQVKHFEGCYLKAYLDSVGIATLGWGRITNSDGSKVKMGQTCTQAQADAWLLEDLESEGAKYVRAFLTNEDQLNSNEFSALVGFTFNRGAGRFREYVAPFLNKGDKVGAMKSLISVNWAGSGHQYLLGLDRRRWSEKYLFEGKDWRAFDTVGEFTAFKNRGYK